MFLCPSYHRGGRRSKKKKIKRRGGEGRRGEEKKGRARYLISFFPARLEKVERGGRGRVPCKEEKIE